MSREYNGSMNYAAVERETSLEAMWHAYRAFHFSPQSEVEANPSIRGALLNARYYDSSRGQFLSEDPTCVEEVGLHVLAHLVERGTVEPCTRISVVDVLTHEGVSCDRYLLLERQDLTLDSSLLRLQVSAHARVQNRSLHT
jgi:hypothetical protein